MRTLWATASAWGGGLVQAALGAGAVSAASAPPAARVIGAALVLSGLLALLWGALCLRSGRILVRRAVPGVAVAGIALIAALLGVSPARTSIAAVAVALLLLVAVAVSAARRASESAPRRRLRVPLWAFALVTVLMTALTVPALASVQDTLLMDADGRVPVIPGHAGH
ncbi:hypothetical protein [Microbacterium sp. SORGH_AS_0888]|uniref:hypothetical protein n=1 Tax=Microbacterium sp. SORGH_AS_0888 TaxID=3041791 RepID=UPI002783732F|nr:hypothetical protein [Microbacterium sp. SORGH_AS_0888]MDQ1128362.1 hypothetical protein [Microbacterium sp. SORGH_AS_0888]